MAKLTQIGRIFFGVAFIGLGIEHFIYEEFIVGRAPSWPESLPGKVIWAYVTGGAFVAAGFAIISGKKARVTAIAAGILILLWALLRQIPVVASDSLLSGTWTMAGKALTLMGGCFAIAATFPEVDFGRNTPLSRFLNTERHFVLLGRVSLGLFFVVTGIQHFMFTEFVASLIPTWFPGDAVFWTYFAGAALISGGAGLFIPQMATVAALMTGLMVFSWFWIVHLPRTLFTVSDGIAVFEALAVSGIAFVLAGYLSRSEPTATRKKSTGAPLPQTTLTI